MAVILASMNTTRAALTSPASVDADTWKVKSNFTLNYGLGYDLETGLFSTFFKRPQYLAPILNGQTGGVPRGRGTPSRYLDFAPQFGFAWAVGGNRRP